MLEHALRGDKRYWSWVIALMAVIGVGVLFYLRQYNEGLGITGLGRDVTWGFYIAQLTFMVGVAASAVMVVLPYYLHNYKAFGKITILGEFVAIGSVIVCVTFVFVDLGQPFRMMNMFLHPSLNSMLFWDSVALSGYFILNIVISHVTLGAERKGIAPPKWIKPVIYLSIPWAVSIHTVTAFLYAGLAARPFWMTAILAPRFLASAFSAGPALLILFCLILRKMTKERETRTTTLVKRGTDRRKANLGRRFERRKTVDRRKPESGSSNYEFVGVSQGGWTKTD